MSKPRKQPSADLETIIPILIGQWRRMTELRGPPDVLQTREFRGVVEKVKHLQANVINGDAWVGTPYFENKEVLGAYTLYQWIIHYLQGLSLINEIPHPPRRVLDLCAGPCPFAFAALRHGASETLALDKSLEALHWGAQICGRYGMPITVRKADCLPLAGQVQGKYDLIILGHALKELFPGMDIKPAQLAKAADYVKNLADYLTPEGHLLIVDSSTLGINRCVLKIRDAVVEKGLSVQAPCVWKGPCPALERNDTPCFAQRDMEKPYLVKEIQRASEIQLGSLKMSYILFRAPGAAWPETDQRPLYRVISPPFDSHFGQTHYLCGVDGKKKLSVVQSHITPSNKAVAHLKRGELIEINGAAERGNVFEILPETSVKIVASCGKAFIPNDSD